MCFLIWERTTGQVSGMDRTILSILNNDRYMRNLYYLIWVDSILSFRKYNPKRSDWKITVYLYITWIHALNWWIIFLWLKFFDILNIPLLKIDVFPGELLDSLFAFAIEFALPFALLNYYLIFYKNRYARIIEKYDKPKKRFALIYSITVALAAFVSAVLYGIFS